MRFANANTLFSGVAYAVMIDSVSAMLPWNAYAVLLGNVAAMLSDSAYAMLLVQCLRNVVR